jgi:5-formyltetrahydrofolate cyclo-ligase
VSETGRKQQVRERIWQALASEDAVVSDPVGRIPNFRGAEATAKHLATLPGWQQARTVKSNPDKPQAPVRILALTEGKTLFMAVPKLAEVRPFYHLNPVLHDHPAQEAATSAIASEFAPTVEVDAMGHIDFIVSGSVAVNPQGVRIGKGAGYADLEIAILIDAGLVDERTILATTVHDSQVLDEDLPEEPHDFRLDRIITPTRVIQCPKSARPSGLDWERIPPEKIAAIPALAARLPR